MKDSIPIKITEPQFIKLLLDKNDEVRELILGWLNQSLEEQQERFKQLSEEREKREKKIASWDETEMGIEQALKNIREIAEKIDRLG
jgi:uncharacterized protein YlxW (UPF0749 family)